MGLLNDNINVVVFGTAPPVTSQGFGTPLFLAAPGTLGAGFTQRVRYYTTATAVAADLTSGDLSAVAAAALNIALQQSPRASRIGCGRIDTLVNGVADITITYGADGDIFTATVTVNGAEIVGTYTAVALDDADLVAAGLGADLTTKLAAEPITVSVLTNVVTLTGTDAEVGFGVTTAVTTATTGAAVVTLATPPTSPQTEMDALFADTSDWYGFSGDPAGFGDEAILSLASWAQTNLRLHIPQSSTTAIKDGTTGHVGATLTALGYDYTGLLYHHSNSEYAAVGWLSKTLAANLDVQSTAWAYKTITGVTISPMTETERGNLQANNVNFYQVFYTFGVMWGGTVANGDYLDIRTTKDWTDARMSERLAQVFLDTYNRNSKVPYTDAGIRSLADVVNSVLIDGVTAGHFLEGSGVVTAPLLVDVPAADKTDRKLNLSFTVVVTGAIQEVTVTGYILIEAPV